MEVITEQEIIANWDLSKYHDPQVCIWCTAFQQENFIAQCLESFLCQKTNFPFEIVVHDDASSDRTADIIREYAARYPSIIKPILEEENLLSKGLIPFGMVMVNHVRTKYVATCEGDDYWCDENKLQKQYDFLEANPQYSMVGHMTKSIDANNQEIETFIDSVPGEYAPPKGKEWTMVSHYSAFFYRNVFLEMSQKELEDFFSVYAPGDKSKPVLFRKYGKLFVLPDQMSVYRFQSSPNSYTANLERDPMLYDSYLEALDLERYASSLGLSIDYSVRRKQLLHKSFTNYLKKGNKDLFKILQTRRNYPADILSCIGYCFGRVGVRLKKRILKKNKR